MQRPTKSCLIKKQAIGVEYIIGADQNNLQRALVKREVLLCAGAIASPQILQRSGVGQSTFLKINGH